MGSIDKYMKVAMKVYCLTDSDRQWIVSRLPAEDQLAVNRYLQQLKEIGLPKNAVFINAAMEALDEKSEKELYSLLNHAVIEGLDTVVSLFEREAGWIGACLKSEYPGLFNSYVTPKLSRRKLSEIEGFEKEVSQIFTSKLKVAVFESVTEQLMKDFPGFNSDKQLGFEEVLQKAV